MLECKSDSVHVRNYGDCFFCLHDVERKLVDKLLTSVKRGCENSADDQRSRTAPGNKLPERSVVKRWKVSEVGNLL